MSIVIVVDSVHVLKGLASAVDSRPKPIGCEPLKNHALEIDEASSGWDSVDGV